MQKALPLAARAPFSAKFAQIANLAKIAKEAQIAQIAQIAKEAKVAKIANLAKVEGAGWEALIFEGGEPIDFLEGCVCKVRETFIVNIRHRCQYHNSLSIS